MGEDYIMEYSKVLIAFYSRTGITKKAALKINELYGFDLEEIVDKKARGGALNYILSGKDALQEKEADIKSIEKDVSTYDLVIICTPVWASNMAPAVRTYINKVKANIKNVAFVCTQASSGADKTLIKLEELIERKSKGDLFLLTKEVAKEEYEGKLKHFIDEL
jgi:flavodoxin